MNYLIPDHFTQLVNCVYSQANTGASVNIVTLGNAPKVGYMVGLQNIAVYDNLSYVNPFFLKAELIKFNEKNNSKRNYFGVWRDTSTKKIWFDVSEWYESESEAIKTGNERNEIAIWDLKNNVEIRL